MPQPSKTASYFAYEEMIMSGLPPIPYTPSIDNPPLIPEPPQEKPDPNIPDDPPIDPDAMPLEPDDQ